MTNLNTEPSIDASYQVSLHLAEGFQRRRLKCEKLMVDGRQVMAKARIAFDTHKNLHFFIKLYHHYNSFVTTNNIKIFQL